MSEAPRSRTFVTAFARGLTVIEAFGQEARRMSLAEVAARTKLDRAVTRRLLLTLVALGYVATDGKQFELTPQVLRLGYSYLAAMGLDSLLQPFLDELSKSIGESTSVSVLDGDEVVFLARSDAAGRRLSYMVTTGMRMPAFATSSGRMLLSTLPDEQVLALLQNAEIKAHTRHSIVDRQELMQLVQRAREVGHSFNDQELDEGLLSASVLLCNRAGRTVAALNASSHVSRMKQAAMAREIVPKMRAMAGRIAAVLL